MQIRVTIEGQIACLLLEGKRFDISAITDLHRAYRPLLDNGNLKTLAVDLSQLEVIDSSALGQLVLLREQALARNMKVDLAHCSPAVWKVLKLAHFDQLFAMSQ